MCRWALVEKISFEIDGTRGDFRDLRDLLDRILDKGIFVDLADRLALMRPNRRRGKHTPITTIVVEQRVNDR